MKARIMGYLLVISILMVLPAIALSSTDEIKSDIREAEKAGVMKTYGKLPLYFIENNGQIDKKVKYYEKGSGHSTFFTGNGVYLSLIKNIKKETEENNNAENSIDRRAVNKNLQRELIELTFIDANKDPVVTAEGVQEGKVNYFIGNDPDKWRSNISTYSIVKYKEIYEGIDIKFYGNNRQLEYDLIVSPGADPAKARLAYSGVEGLRVTEEGELEIELKEGKIIQKRPYIYQEIEGKRVVIEGSFRLKENNSEGKEKSFEYGFKVASYDRKYPLVIDPVLVYSTYLGGTGNDDGLAIAVDSSGNAHVTGSTASTIDFPTQSAYQGTHGGGGDVFVTKLNAAGSALIYSTYLGGIGSDYGRGIAVDSNGNAYVTGSTTSTTDFPTLSAFQGTHGGGTYDVFVTKLNAAGSALYSTYLGGSGDEIGYAIAVSNVGYAYVTGWTDSTTDFPTTEFAFQGSNAGDVDAFVTLLDDLGSGLTYSTFLGGTFNDYGRGIAVDSFGYAYVTGYTWSTDFHTRFPYQLDQGGVDAFVTVLNELGTAPLIYSSYLGGTGADYGYAIAINNQTYAYVTGLTSSTDFPTQSAYQGSNGGGASDAFITKMDLGSSDLTYSTYLGGSGSEYGRGIAVDSVGNAYVTGETASTDFPTWPGSVSPYQGSLVGDVDAFVTILGRAGAALTHSTYWGGTGSGSNSSYGTGIAVDSSGNAYVTGGTSTAYFPIVSAYQESHGGGVTDAFVMKIAQADVTRVSAGTGLTGGGTGGAVTLNVDFAGTGSADTAARSDHDHPGEDIVSGIVADSVIDPAIARDSEIMTIVLANDGSGTTLDADFLDGQDSSAFADASHAHPGIILGGDSNTFVGIDAGVSNTTGTINTFIGRNAGKSNITGNNNTFLGWGAGQSNTAGVRNTFLGVTAGFRNDTGLDNTFIGYQAGTNNDTGNNNTFIGKDAGIRNITGNNNTFIGSDAVYWTTASNNTFLGTGAGTMNSTGGNNTFLGDAAGVMNEIGNHNTFIGNYAGYSNTAGDNTFIGYQAGQNNQTGASNIFMGVTAGFSNIAGASNIFLGSTAGYSNTDGSNNIFMGLMAGYNNIIGNYNTFLGNYAGESNTASNNTFIGHSAGGSNISGNYNTFIGRNAGGSNIIGAGNVFVGDDAGGNEIGSNKLYIDNSNTSSPLIWGDFNFNVVNINGRLGVGTMTPSTALEVNGTVTATSFIGDGSGLSGINDADTVDGQHASAFMAAGTDGWVDTTGDTMTGNLTVNGNVTATSFSGDGSALTGIVASVTDADTVDGQHASAFMAASTDNWVDITGDSMTGSLSVAGNVNATLEYQIAGTRILKAKYDNTFLGKDAGGSNDGTGNVFLGYHAGFSETGSNKLYIDIGLSSPLIYGEFDNEFVEINGDFYVTGNTYVDSDERLKKDIKPIESSLEKILGIKGVSYKWKNQSSEGGKSSNMHYGVIAQQVEKVIPEIVNDRQDDKKRVAYLELIPVLIEAVKEQQKTISQLSDKLKALEQEVKFKGSLAMANTD
jgi:hypothetical protein